MDSKHYSGNLRDVLHIFFKYRGRMIAVFFAVAVVATVVTFLTPPAYEAKSTVMIKFGREYVYRPELGEGRPPLFLTSGEGVINSEMQILTSRDLLKRVVTEIGHEKMYGDSVDVFSPLVTPVDAAVMKLEQDIKVENKGRSDVIQIAYVHRNPEIAAKAVNLLVDLFREKHLQVYSGTTTPFLERQLAIYGERLKDAESRLEAFKQKHKVYSIDEQRGFLIRQRTDLDTIRISNENQIQELQQKIAFIQKHGEFETARSAAVEGTRSHLLTLKMKELDLLKRYKESSQAVTNVRDEIDIITRDLEKQKQNASKMEVLKLQEDVDLLRSRNAGSSQGLARLNAEIQELDSKDRDFQTLRRDVTVTDANYRTYQGKLEEAKLSDDMDRQKMANISVIQKAFTPVKPIRPKTEYNLTLGLIMGALAALGVGFLSEYASQGVSTPDKVRRKLGLPVLASLPHKGAI